MLGKKTRRAIMFLGILLGINVAVTKVYFADVDITKVQVNQEFVLEKSVQGYKTAQEAGQGINPAATYSEGTHCFVFKKLDDFTNISKAKGYPGIWVKNADVNSTKENSPKKDEPKDNQNKGNANKDTNVSTTTIKNPGYIRDVNVNSLNIQKGSNFIIKLEPSNSSIVTEYSVDEVEGEKEIRLIDWNSKNTQEITIKTLGKKVIRVNSRNKANAGVAEDSRTFVIKGIAASHGWIRDYSFASGIKEVGSQLSISITPHDSAITTEYSVDDVTDGGLDRINEWNTNSLQKITLNKSGKRVIRINSRNKSNAGEIEDSRNIIINVVEHLPGYLYDAEIFGSGFVDYPVTINAYPNDKSMSMEYSVDDMTGENPIRVADWSENPKMSFTPKTTGKKIYRVNSRNKKSGGAIEDSRNLRINISKFKHGYLNGASISAAPYNINNQIILTAIPLYSDSKMEYSVDEMIGNNPVRIVDWTDNREIRFYPKSEGDKVYRLNSRNKFTGDQIEDSRNFKVTVVKKFSIDYNTSTTDYEWSWGYPAAKDMVIANGGYFNYKDSVYLTFDDGYEYQNNSAAILDILKSKNVKAVFFVTGEYIKSNPELVKRMEAEGHIVGNHTRWHLFVSEAGSNRVVQDIIDWEEDYKALFGRMPEVKLYRPAAGQYSERTLISAKQLGYKTLFWGFGLHDYDPSDQPSASYVLSALKNNTKKGNIVLLHAVSKTNTRILGEYIDWMRENGFNISQFR